MLQIRFKESSGKVRKLVLLLSVLLLVLNSYAQQKSTLKGIIHDGRTHQALPGSTVSLFKVKDSIVSSSITNTNGYFEINNIDSGSYDLTISHQGFETYKKLLSVRKGEIIDLAAIKLEKSYKTLAEVVVKDKTPVKLKGDTLAYNAEAFKTKPNATVEDLLKKLPGVQVDREGNVKTQGEQIQKVYVDGKEYFSDDPKLATMNLTADMVEQVQVFDDKSEQAKFNGIDDGSRTKAINLRLKKEKKTGISGNVYAGAGTGGQYQAGVRANYFKGASQLSLIAGTNNINKAGVGTPDINNSRNRNNGLTNHSSVGLNYRDTWSKSFDANGSYHFSNILTNNLRRSSRQIFLTDSTIIAGRESNNSNQNGMHRFSQKIIYTIDTFNSIVYTTNLSLRHSDLSATDLSNDLINNTINTYLGTDSRIINATNGNGHSWNNNLIWRRKFTRPRRTLSANFTSYSNMDNRNGFNTINSSFYNSTGFIYRERNTDYKTGNKNKAGNYMVSLSYTEPVSKTGMVEVNYTHHKGGTASDRNTFSYNDITKQYDELNDTLTNHFQQHTIYDMVGANFSETKKKFNYQAGMALQRSTLSSDNLSNKINLSQRFLNVIPTASIQYQFSKNKRARLYYRGRNNQPNLTQLQDFTDISNYPYIRKGNPALRQEFAHNLMLNYNFFNTTTFRNISASLFYNTVRNKIVNSLVQRAGEQISMPVNVNGVYNASGTFGYSIPINRMEGGNLSFNTRASYKQATGLINEEKNIAKNLILSEEVTLSFNYKDKLDLDLSAGLDYNTMAYSVSKAQNQSYLSHNYRLDATYNFENKFIISSIVDYTAYSRNAAEGGNSYIMWNASISRELLKNNRGMLIFSVNNLLNQQNSIVRNVYENIIEDVQTNTQGRFALLTFTYNLNNLKLKNKSDR